MYGKHMMIGWRSNRPAMAYNIYNSLQESNSSVMILKTSLRPTDIILQYYFKLLT